MRIPLIALFTFLAFSCDKDDEEEKKQITIPQVNLECQSPATACADNSANGATLIAYWSNTVCRDSNSADQIKAGGNVQASCTEGVCTGSVSEWYAFDGTSISTLEEGTYFLCGGVDLDDSGDLNQAGEPVAIVRDLELKEGIEAQVANEFEDQT